jgi:hypothetical protein
MGISEAEARTFGSTPSEFRAHLISMGCPAELFDRVERRNKALAPLLAERRAANRGHGAHRSKKPHSVTVTQAQIDEMVDNRDLTKYPLSAYERLERERDERRRRILATIL